jgi:transcription antitermination factor NusG
MPRHWWAPSATERAIGFCFLADSRELAVGKAGCSSYLFEDHRREEIVATACKRGGEAAAEQSTVELISAIPEAVPTSPPEAQVEENWYAIYTWARHEKRVAEQLEQRQLRNFLPLYRALHRWKDRRKEVELALFPGYVFVHLALRHRLRVLEIPSVVHLVSFQGKPAPLPEHEIEKLLQGANGRVRMGPHPYLQAGQRVRVRTGPVAGLEGILLRRKEGARLVVSIEILMRAVAIEIDEADVEPLIETRSRNT